MQKFKHHCIIDEINYDKDELISFFQSIPKKCELPWNKYKNVIKDDNPNQVYRSGRKFQRRGEGGLNGVYTPLWEGKHMTEYPQIKKIIDRFNFLQPIIPEDVTFMTYNPGFVFANHTDRYLEYNIMFPLIPDDGGEPITFYKGEDKDRDNPLGVEYTYKYHTNHPTIFNGKTIHSVDKIKEYRVMLRIKVSSEKYEDMIKRYEAGKFII